MLINIQQLPGSFILLITVILGLALFVFAWRHRASSGAVPFAFLMLASAVWAAFDALENLSLSPTTKVIWARLAYLGIAFLPTFWFIFAMRFGNQGRWIRSRLSYILLFVIPLVTLILAWTNDAHHLIWSNILPVPGSTELVYEHGPWFWFFMLYSYIQLLSGAFIVLVTTLVRYPYLYRRQAFSLVIGTILPWICNLIYLLRLNPFPGTDLTSFGFSVGGLFYAWSFFRFRLFELIPVARDILIEHMNDGVLVIDKDLRIVDVNPKALLMLGTSASSLLGQPAVQLFNFPEDTFQVDETREPSNVTLQDFKRDGDGGALRPARCA